MRPLLLILILPLLLFVCALIVLWVPLPHPLPPALSAGRNRMAAGVTGIVGAGYLVGLAVYVISSFLQAGRALDPVLTSAGLEPQGYVLFGRQYHGEIQGRRVDVYYLPAQAISPAQLNVYLEADLGTRVAIGRQRPLLDCGDCAQLTPDEPSLDTLQVYAQEETCARSLLADATSRGALIRLMTDQETAGSREVYLQPDRVWLRARPQTMTEEQFQQWLDDLLALAEAAERALASSGCIP